MGSEAGVGRRSAVTLGGVEQIQDDGLPVGANVDFGVLQSTRDEVLAEELKKLIGAHGGIGRRSSRPMSRWMRG